MIDIITIAKGERYSFDPETQRIFKDGVLLPSTEVEPIYSSVGEDDPKFSGILLKATGSILTLSGNVNPVSDINTIV